MLKSNILDNNLDYNLPVRIDLVIGAGQFEYIDLSPAHPVSAYGVFNDIHGSIFFDKIEKKLLRKIIKKIDNEIPEKYRWLSPISVRDSSILNKTMSIREFSSYYDKNRYINLYSIFPSTIIYKKSNDYELFMFNFGPGISNKPYSWIDIGMDLSLTTIRYKDNNIFEKARWAIRPSFFYGIELRAFPRKLPIVLGLQFGKRYLWPIKFYDETYHDEKFKQIKHTMITLNYNFKKDFPIKETLLE